MSPIVSPAALPKHPFPLPRTMTLKNLVKTAALAAAALLTQVVGAQTTDTWVSTGSGAWGTAANWSSGVPTASSIATFNSVSGLQTSVTLTAAANAYSLNLLGTGGANAYTFDTAGTVNADTLTLASGLSNADSAGATFYNATTLGASQTWTNNAGSLTFDGRVNLGSGTAGRTLTVAGSGAVTVNGVVGNGGSAAGSVVMAGTGTLTLAGADTYSGTTTVSSGTLSLTNNASLGSGSGSTTVAAGAVLQLSNGITTSNTGTLTLNGTGTGAGALENLSGSNTWNSNVALGSNSTLYSAVAGTQLTIGNAAGTSLFSLGANTLTVDGPGDTWLYSNLGVSGDTGGLVKNGTGTLTLYGYNSYYTGATQVNAGTLDLVVGPFSTGWYGINGSLTIGVGPSNASLAGTVNVTILSDSYANQISPNSAVTINSDGALNVGASTSMGTLTLGGGELNISSGITATTAGIVSNTNSAHETSTISGGTLISTTGTFNVARDSTLGSDLTVTSVIGGTNLSKNGAGILTLAAANTYTGSTTINAGTIQTTVNNALPSGHALTIASGAALNLAGTSQTVGALSNAGAVNFGSGGTFTLNGAASLGGTLSGTGTLILSSGSTLTLGANFNDAGLNITLAGGTLYVAGTNDTFGTLSVTSTSIVDFGSPSKSLLDVSGISIGSGQTLKVNNWSDLSDYLYSNTNPGSAVSQIVFTNTTGTVHWNTYTDGPDNFHQITPAPEPATYGALFVGLSLIAVMVVRRRRAA